MKFFMCFTLFVTIACMMISRGDSSGGGGGYEMKKMRKSSGRSAPQGFITIEMDQDSGNSGWGSGGGSGWNSGSGWKEMPKMQMSIKINKKLDLGPMLAMLGSMGSSGWDDDSSEDSWSSGGGSRSYGGGGSGGGYGGGSSYGGGNSGWSSGGGSNYGGGNNGYDGMSGYSSNRQYRRRKY